MAERNGRERKPKPELPRWSLLDGLQVVFFVAVSFGLFFYLRGPPANELHALFRLGIVIGGGTGLVAVSVLKLMRQGRL